MKFLPIKNYKHGDYPQGSVTQWFGENPSLYQKAIDTNGHNGIDIVAPWGTPLFAVDDGAVVDVKNDPNGFGKHIRFFAIKDKEAVEWTYGHCSNIYVKVGDKIKAGDHIADMGNTGFVVSGATPYWEHNPYAGTHLHLGKRIHKLNHAGWSYPNSEYRVITQNYDNGFKGAIDFKDELKECYEGSSKESPVLTPDEVKSIQLTIISLQNQVISLLRQIISLWKTK